MKTRQLEGIYKIAFSLVAILFTATFFVHSGIRILSTQMSRSLYLLGNVLMAFMLYPVKRGHGGQKKVPWYDLIACAAAIFVFLYWAVTYREYAIARKGQANMTDFYLGIIAIILVMESCRRVIGWIIPIIALVFSVQLYFGPYMPGVFANKGFSLFRIVDFMYRTDQAIFGTICNTFSVYVLPFVIMGAFMEYTGAGEFFIKMALALTKGWAGGPAKVAVIASGLFGSISGSSSANVVSTGAFTIPMMKKVGFPPEDAGAIEAAASTGGQMLPPVMGAGAFLLAAMTETPYARIALICAIPAILYYYWCALAVHYKAKRDNIGSLPDEEIPDAKATFKEGWFFFVPIIVIFVVLGLGYSADKAAFWAIVLCIGFSFFTKEHKMTPKKLIDAFEKAGRSEISVGGTIGCLGIVMGGIVLGGLAQKFGVIVVSLSHGSIFIAICLTGLVGAIIGMGATQTATYVLMSLIVVQGLVKLGIDVVTANVIAFWFSAVSNVTPPVCVSAFAGASIAGADPMKTGFKGVKYSAALFFLPFAFYYLPGLLIHNASVLSALYDIGFCLIAIPMVAASLYGFFIANLDGVLRITAGIAGVCGYIPNIWTRIVSAVFFIVLIFVQRKKKGNPSKKQFA